MTHTAVVAAPVAEVYRLVADVTLWPVVFGPTVHVEHLHRTSRDERFQLWALVGGQVRTWVSRRELDPDRHRITFRQERSHAPIAAMAGAWSLRPDGAGRTEVVLDHVFSVTDPAELAAISAAVDRNSTEELAALRRFAELGPPLDELVDTFSDTVVLPGRLADLYDFINRGDLWPQRLPHVARVALTEDEPGIQHLEMDTVTADGATHTTRSIRVCAAPASIAYKQLVPPAMLLGHSGRWQFTERPDGVEVTATHTVAIDPAAAEGALGADDTLARARRYLRAALGGNGRATLDHAGRHAAAGTAASADS
ncbi:aromatase/cyclase [Frankia sp. AgKG'84/4]